MPGGSPSLSVHHLRAGRLRPGRAGRQGTWVPMAV